MKISVIIVHRENESIKKVIDAVLASNYNKKLIEIIAVSGNQPSVQRNQAAKKIAKGDILVFLDNDSIVSQNYFEKITPLFKSPKTAIVGGPSVQKNVKNIIQKAINEVLTSSFGAGKIKYRYISFGKIREANELELILCNMAVRRKLFIKMKGFDESLYPNEENVFIEKVRKTGYNVYHHPEAIVYRAQRETFSKFIKQIFNYGRGRAEQTFVAPGTFKIFILISVGFVLYICSLLFIHNFFYFIPLFFYLGLNSTVAFLKSILNKNLKLFYYLFTFFFCTHFFYGIGFIYGFFKKLFIKSKKEKIYFKIKKVKSFG